MKKVFMLIAVCAVTAFASAQTTVRGSKLTDNISVGINAGGVTPLTGHKFFGDLRPTLGLNIAKEITPIFGIGAEINAVINAQHNLIGATDGTGTTNATRAFDLHNLGGFVTVNLNNLFHGYKGTPDAFEVKAVYGFGWGHEYYKKDDNDRNFLTTKAGLNLAYNFGAAKAWQVNIKPAIVWDLTDGRYASAYDSKLAHVELLAGVTYKFKNSNGTHNFTLVKEYDQAEVDGLNAKINDLRSQLNAKDQQLSAEAAAKKKLQDELNDCRNRQPAPAPAPVTNTKTVNNLETNVFFAQGKSVITLAQQPNVERVATYLKNHPNSKVAIKGYASPEGSKEINDKLSKARAEAVKTMLVKKYKINANRITTEGCGVGDLFTEKDWNRVAISTLSE